jgi:hypothetical protein
MRKVNTTQQRSANPRLMPASRIATVKMTMRYSVVRVTIPNISIPQTASARDVINAWWGAAERDRIIDPNIFCLSRDPEAFDIRDENGNQVEIEEGAEIFLAPLNKTNPEVLNVDVIWDGFDTGGFPLRLSISPRVHRETPRTRLLGLWSEHFKMTEKHAEVASHLYTDENEYYWTDQAGKTTAPPWEPGQPCCSR